MDMLNRPLAVILALIAVVMLFHFLFNPFYPDSVDIVRMWNILNWFMAFGVAAALIVSCVHKRGLESGRSDDSEHVCVNVMFYAAALLAIWFFWNWFDDLNVGEDGQGQTNLIIWTFINPLFVIVMGAVSARLWRDA